MQAPSALFEIDWEAHRSALQASIRAADARRVNTNRAKRLLRELQAYIAAAAAIRHLDDVTAKAPCGAAPLRTAVARLEEASSTLSHPTNPVLPFGPSLFAERLSAARSRLDVERASEALAKEVKAVKGVDQLQRLEAAILAAKKVGAESLDPASYAAAAELRERLAHAFRVCNLLRNMSCVLRTPFNNPQYLLASSYVAYLSELLPCMVCTQSSIPQRVTVVVDALRLL